MAILQRVDRGWRLHELTWNDPLQEIREKPAYQSQVSR